MGRVTWFVAGAGLGALAANRLRKVAQPLTGEELRDRVHAATIGLKQARQTAAQARVDRETELRDRYAGQPAPTPADPNPVDPSPVDQSPADPSPADPNPTAAHVMEGTS